jgi:hypothetical protein
MYRRETNNLSAAINRDAKLKNHIFLRQRMVHRLACLLCLLLSAMGCSKRMMLKNYPVHPKSFAGISNPNPYQEDFLYLKTLSEEVVPLADKYFPPDKRAAMEKDILARLGDSQCTQEVFTYCIRRYLAGFTNEHAYIGEGAQDPIDNRLYPVLFHYVGDELFVANVGNTSDPAIIGQKVVTINGRPVAEVEERLGETNYYSRPVYCRLAGLTDVLNESLKLEFAGHTPATIGPAKDPISWHHGYKPHAITIRANNLYDGLVFTKQNYAYSVCGIGISSAWNRR